MATVDERPQFVGAAVAAGGGEIAGRLVTPGFVQRVLRDRHQLDMGVAHVGGIGDQRFGKFAVRVAAAVRMAPPRSCVHFVDVHRRMQPVGARTPLEPRAVAPRMLRRPAYPRRRCRAQLEALRVRVGFHHHRAAGAVADFVFVQRASGQFRNEQFPHPACAARLQRMHAPVPAVEVTDHAHALRIGRPHCEAHTRHAHERHWLRAEAQIALMQAAGAEQIEVVRGDRKREGVGIEALLRAVPVLEAQAAGRWRARAEPRFEQPGNGPAHERHPAVGRRQCSRAGMRVVRAHDPAIAAELRTETAVGVVQARLGEERELRIGSGCDCARHGVTRRIMPAANGPVERNRGP